MDKEAEGEEDEEEVQKPQEESKEADTPETEGEKEDEKEVEKEKNIEPATDDTEKENEPVEQEKEEPKDEKESETAQKSDPVEAENKEETSPPDEDKKLEEDSTEKEPEKEVVKEEEKVETQETEKSQEEKPEEAEQKEEVTPEVKEDAKIEEPQNNKEETDEKEDEKTEETQKPENPKEEIVEESPKDDLNEDSKEDAEEAQDEEETPVKEEDEPEKVEEEQNEPEKQDEKDKEPEKSEEKEEPAEEIKENPEVSNEETTSPSEDQENPEEQIEASPSEPEKHIMDHLFDFVRSDEERNPVLCGYFCKFLNNLMNYNRFSFCRYVYDPENTVISSLIKHIYNRSIADSIVKILNDTSPKIEHKETAIKEIITGIASQDFEGKLNSALVLKDLIDNKNLVAIFQQEDVNNLLFDLVLEEEEDLTKRAALDTINALYKKFPFYVKENGDPFVVNYLLKEGEQNEEEKRIMPFVLDLLETKVLDICKLLDNVPSETLDQQYGTTIEPFGATKLQVVKFIKNIIAIGEPTLAIKLSSYLPVILNYCNKYPWNSMLHNTVESIFEEIFKSDSRYDDGFKTATIAESSLIDFIHDCAADTNMPDSDRPIRNGLIATVISIANILDKCNNEYVKEELTKNDKWINFAYTELKESNERNERALAGHQSKGADLEEETSNYETSMDKLFAVFTNLKDSHDSSRNDSDSDEEEVDTENILEGIETSSEGSEQESPKKEETKETEGEGDEETQDQPQEPVDDAKEETKTEEAVSEEPQNTQAESDKSEEVEKTSESPEGSATKEAAKETSLQPDNMVEENTFYDNSYWSVQSNYDLDDLLQDT